MKISNHVLVIAPGYLAVISLVAVIVTVYDKIAAKKRPRHRVPENTLLLLAVLGGGLAEYITMLLIRHKTRHKIFMIGLPVIILAETLAIALLYHYGFFIS